MFASTTFGDLSTAEQLLVASELVVVVLGLTIAYIAYRGYRRNESRPMLFVSLGFILLVGVPAVGGMLFLFVGLGEVTAAAINRASTIAGMTSILYGLRWAGG